MATLRIGLLPEEIDPSKEVLVLAVGTVVSAGTETLERFPALLKTCPDIPYVHYAFGLSLAKAGRGKAERNSDPLAAASKLIDLPLGLVFDPLASRSPAPSLRKLPETPPQDWYVPPLPLSSDANL